MSEVDQNRSTRPKSGGRQRGTPNRVTAELREAITDLVRGNIAKAQGWLDRVAADSPAKALELLMGLSRYAIPELKALAVDVREPLRSPRQMSVAELQAIILENDLEESPERLMLPAPHAGLV